MFKNLKDKINPNELNRKAQSLNNDDRSEDGKSRLGSLSSLVGDALSRALTTPQTVQPATKMMLGRSSTAGSIVGTDSISEVDDSIASGAVLGKEELYQRYERARALAKRYKTRYMEMHETAQRALQDKVKLEQTLADSQDRAIRRQDEMRQELDLERHAKQDVEQNYVFMLEEQAEKIATLQLQVSLLREGKDLPPELEAKIRESHQRQTEGEKKKEDLIRELQASLTQKESLLHRCKEKISSMNSQLTELKMRHDSLQEMSVGGDSSGGNGEVWERMEEQMRIKDAVIAGLLAQQQQSEEKTTTTLLSEKEQGVSRQEVSQLKDRLAETEAMRKTESETNVVLDTHNDTEMESLRSITDEKETEIVNMNRLVERTRDYEQEEESNLVNLRDEFEKTTSKVEEQEICIVNLKMEAAEANDKLMQREQDFVMLITNIKEKETEILSLRTAVLTEVEQKKNEVENKMEILCKEIEEKSSENLKLKEEVSKMYDRIQEMKIEIVDLLSRVSEEEVKLIKKESEMAVLRSELERERHTITENAKVFSNSRLQSEENEAEMENLKATLAAQLKENVETRTEIECLCARIEVEREIIGQKDEEILTLRGSAQEASANIHECEEMISNLRRIIEENEFLIGNLQSEMKFEADELMGKKDKEIIQLKESMTAKAEELLNLQRERDEADKTMEERNSENERLKSVEMKHAGMMEMKESFNREQEKTAFTISNLHSDAEEVNKRLQEKELEIADLRSTIEVANCNIAQKDGELVGLKLSKHGSDVATCEAVAELTRVRYELEEAATGRSFLVTTDREKDAMIGDLRRELEACNDRIGAKETEIASLSKEIDEYSGKIDEQKTEIESLIKLKVEIQEKQIEVELTNERLVGKERENRDIKRLSEKVEDKLQKQDVEYENLRTEFDSSHRKARENEEEILNLQKEKEKALIILQEHETELTNFRIEIERKDVELETLKRELEEMKSEFYCKETESFNLKRMVEEKETVNAGLRTLISLESDAKKHELEAKVDRQQKELEMASLEAAAENRKREEHIRTLESELNVAQRQLEQSQVQVSCLEVGQQQVEKLQRENAALASKLDKINAAFISYLREIVKTLSLPEVNFENKSFKKILLSGLREHVVEERQCLQGKLEIAARERDILDVQLRVLEENLERSMQDKLNLEQERTEQDREIKQLNTVVENESKEIQELTKKLEKDNSLKDKEKSEKEILKVNFEKEFVKIELLGRELQSKEQENKSLNIEIEKNKTNFGSLSENLEKEQNNRKKELCEKEDLIKKLEMEIEDKNRLKELLKVEKKELENLNKTFQFAKCTGENLKEEVDLLKCQLKKELELKAIVEEQKNDTDRLREQLQTEKVENERLKKALNNERSERENEFDEKGREASDKKNLTVMLEQEKADHEILRQELQKLQEKIEILTNAVEKERKEKYRELCQIEKLTTEKDELLEELEQEKEARNGVDEELLLVSVDKERLKNEKQRLEGVCEELEKESLSRGKEIEDLRHKLKVEVQESAFLREETDQFRQRLKEIQSLLDSLRAESAKQRMEMESLQLDNEDLKNRHLSEMEETVHRFEEEKGEWETDHNLKVKRLMKDFNEKMIEKEKDFQKTFQDALEKRSGEESRVRSELRSEMEHLNGSIIELELDKNGLLDQLAQAERQLQTADVELARLHIDADLSDQETARQRQESQRQQDKLERLELALAEARERLEETISATSNETKTVVDASSCYLDDFSADSASNRDNEVLLMNIRDLEIDLKQDNNMQEQLRMLQSENIRLRSISSANNNAHSSPLSNIQKSNSVLLQSQQNSLTEARSPHTSISDYGQFCPYPITDSTDYEYLRGVLVKYMTGMETETLAKVVSTVMQFSHEELQKIHSYEQNRKRMVKLLL